MKTTTYVCDNITCDNETENLKHFDWIEIGSENNTLYVNNNLEDRQINFMSNHNDIHFCSSKCFTEFFVKTT